MDWKYNPTEFEYRLSEDGKIQRAMIESVKEFEIQNVCKYERHDVDIDRTSDVTNKLKYDKAPVFKNERLFLKVLVAGKATLYWYENGNLVRFFYSKNGSPVEQLIHKKYLVVEKETKREHIGANNEFRRQLWLHLKCSSIIENKLKNLLYRKNHLVPIFVAYNTCNNSETITYDKKQKRDFINISLRPRYNSSSLSIVNSFPTLADNPPNADFENETGFGFGIEAEFILPFNKNKWGIIIEPTYQTFKSSALTTRVSFPDVTITAFVDYKSIELPIGLRHYLFLNDKSKIFLNASYTLDFHSNSSITFIQSTSPDSPWLELVPDSAPNFAFGAGYKYNNRYSIEFRYLTDRNIFNGFSGWLSHYETFSMVFGYSLF